MSQSDIRHDLSDASFEPLLPLEKKLIGWCLGTGVTVLIILVFIERYVPVTF